MDEEKYTLSKLIDLTGLIKSPILKSPRLKVSKHEFFTKNQLTVK